MNLRDKIFNAKDIQEETVTVKAWGVKVLVKGLTGVERSTILQNAVDQKTGVTDLIRLYPDLVIATSYDPETGEKIFTLADRDALNAKSGLVLEEIAKVSLKLSGMDEQTVQDIGKN